MEKLKKIMVILLALLCVFAFMACGDDDKADSPTDEQLVEEEENTVGTGETSSPFKYILGKKIKTSVILKSSTIWYEFSLTRTTNLYFSYEQELNTSDWGTMQGGIFAETVKTNTPIMEHGAGALQAGTYYFCLYSNQYGSARGDFVITDLDASSILDFDTPINQQVLNHHPIFYKFELAESANITLSLINDLDFPEAVVFSAPNFKNALIYATKHNPIRTSMLSAGVYYIALFANSYGSATGVQISKEPFLF